MTDTISIYLETGKKRVFAAALDWPGWSRSGGDEASARQALYETASRFAGVLSGAGIVFPMPADLGALRVVERLEGNATTDFGAPDAVPVDDTRAVDAVDVERLQALLQAYWGAFDRAVQAASGVELRTGPRGGGRDLEKIILHVLNADAAYLSRLGWKSAKDESADLHAQLQSSRQAILDGLAAGARGELPTQGPRGGKIWSPRTFARRSGWHVLDHTWEIEDRMIRS